MQHKPCSLKQEMMLKCNADIMVCGGAAGGGKSHILTMIPLRYLDCPNFRGIMFRRTYSQLSKAGNLWDKGKEVFLSLTGNKKPHTKGGTHIIWPHGPEIEYSHMQHEKDKENIQGAEYTFIGVDEGCQFHWSQLEYMMSRLRSNSKYPSRMVISCNPDPDHELAIMIDWWLDKDGFPIKEREGVVRWYVRRSEQFIWADSSEELEGKYTIVRDGKVVPVKPLSFTFIGSQIYDNPICMELNPGYVSFLEGLNPIDKARLLDGNWKIRPKGSSYLQREWLKKAHTIPYHSVSCRAWDKAASEPSDVYKHPDYTASCKMYKSPDGYFYIVGNHCPESFDKELNARGVFRKRAGERDEIIRKQAIYDSVNTKIVLAQDPGSSGIFEYQQAAKALIEQGFVVKQDPMPGNNSKLTRFQPFASAAENGLVYIIESSFDATSLEHFYKRLEAFNGERSSNTYKDDIPDATASAYNYLQKRQVLQSFVLPSCGRNEKMTKLKVAVRN